MMDLSINFKLGRKILNYNKLNGDVVMLNFKRCISLVICIVMLFSICVFAENNKIDKSGDKESGKPDYCQKFEDNLLETDISETFNSEITSTELPCETSEAIETLKPEHISDMMIDNEEDAVDEENYSVKRLSDGQYIAVNIMFRDVEIYVTDGYNPIQSAEVKINDCINITDENGIAFFEDIPVTDEIVYINVNSGYYGEKTEYIYLSSSEILEDKNSVVKTNKCTVSFWSREMEPVRIINETNNFSGVNDAWKYDNDTGLTTGGRLESYNGDLYYLGEEVFKTYNPNNGRWATLSGSGYPKGDTVTFCNGKIYAYSAYWKADGDDNWSLPYTFSYYDLEKDINVLILSGKSGGKFYESGISCDDKIYFAGGTEDIYDSDTAEPYNYIDIYNTTTQQYEPKMPLGSDWSYKAVVCEEPGEYYHNIFYFHDNAVITRVITSIGNCEYINTSEYIKYEGQSMCVSGGKVYFISGEDADVSLQIYDCKNNTWSKGKDIPNECVNYSSVVYDKYIYVMNYKNIYIYNTETDEWKKGESPDKYMSGNAVLYGDKIYVMLEDGTLGIYKPEMSIDVHSENCLAASGENHFVMIKEGEVYSQGDNTYGQLGTGDNEFYSELKKVEFNFNNEKVIKVSTREDTTFAVTENHILYGWGKNDKYQIGDGTNTDRNIPVQIMTDVADISAGESHAVALKTNGDVYGWGDNTYGQLGISISYQTLPVKIYSGVNSIATGNNHSFVINENSALFATGYNANGQLGIPAKTSQKGFTHVMDNVIKAAGGIAHTVILDFDGNVYTCGSNSAMQLGRDVGNSNNYSDVPTIIGTASDVWAALGSTAYLKAGKLYQCGTGIYPEPGYFTQIIGVENPQCVSLGKVCYSIDNYNNLWRWGLKSESAETTRSCKSGVYIPQKIELYYKFKDVDSYRMQSLAIDENNDVWGWGEGYYGDGTDKMTIQNYPVRINGISDIVQVERGKNHNLALDKNGDVWGWGSNSNYPMGGKLGGKARVPTKLDISDVKMIAAGTEFSVFLKNDGSLWGVGMNGSKQLTNSSEASYTEPIQLSDKYNFVSVKTGESKTIALDSSGNIYAWGAGAEISKIDVNFTDGKSTKFTDITAGQAHFLGLTDAGCVYGWGNNTQGELGVGDKINKTEPTLVQANTNTYLQGIKSISAGYRQSFAISNDGTVYGFGSGGNYQLAIQNTGTYKLAAHISALDGKNIKKIAAGDGYSIALDGNGSIYSFGQISKGVLGIYDTIAKQPSDKAEKDLNWLNNYMNKYGYNITQDIILPNTGENGCNITWHSSNESYISSEGKVTRPDMFSKDESVTLSAEIYDTEKYLKAKFNFVVENEDADYVLSEDVPERVKNNKLNTTDEDVELSSIINDGPDEGDSGNVELAGTHTHNNNRRAVNDSKTIILDKSKTVFSNTVPGGDKVTAILKAPKDKIYYISLQNSANTLIGSGNKDNFFYNENISVANAVASREQELNFWAFSPDEIYSSSESVNVMEFTSCNPDMFEPNQNMFEAGVTYKDKKYGQENYDKFNEIVGGHNNGVKRTRLNLDSSADVDMFAVDLNPGEKITICAEMYCDNETSSEYVIGVLDDFEIYRDRWTSDGNRELSSTVNLYLCESIAVEENENYQTRMATWVAQHTGGKKRYYIAIGKYGIDFEIGNRIDYDLSVVKVDSCDWNDDNEAKEVNVYGAGKVTLTNDFISVGFETIATELNDGVAMTGSIDSQLDVDWFRYTPSSSGEKTFELDGRSSLALCDGYQFLDYNKQSLTYDLNAGQEYYIAVYCPDDETGQPYKYYNDYISEKPDYTLGCYSGSTENVLEFVPKTGGKYIYSNNREVVDLYNLADSYNPNGSKLLFSQSELKTGTYTMMMTHRNETPYNLYLDVQFYDPNPNSNSKIKITKYGDDRAGIGHNKSWASMPGYAGYFGSPIGKVRKQVNDIDDEDDELTISYEGVNEKIKYPENYFITNNSIWLSTQYNNDIVQNRYPTLVKGELMYIMMEFEVVSDTGITVSVAAFHAEGDFDNRFNSYIPTDNAPYEVDDAMKGIAEFKPEVEAPLYFRINNDTELDIPQNVTIKNQFFPNGLTTNWWKTHMNPQFEEYNADYNVESDILPLNYRDSTNNKIWIFDTKRSRWEGNEILPQPEIIGEFRGSSNHDVGCNLGNYGVRTTYKVTVDNITDSERKFCFNIEKNSNIFLSVRNEKEKYMQFEVNGMKVNAICTGESNRKGDLYPTDSGDVIVSLPTTNQGIDNITELQVVIPAHDLKTFYVDVVLPTGNQGSIPSRILFR